MVDDMKLDEPLNEVDGQGVQDIRVPSNDDVEQNASSSCLLLSSSAADLDTSSSMGAGTSGDALSSSSSPEPACSAGPELPSSVHQRFSVQTGDDFLLVTDDDVGFYVDRTFLLYHSEFFRDFEDMAAEITDGDVDGNSNNRIVRRDMPGTLSRGLRVLLLKVMETKSWPDSFDNKRKVCRAEQTWEYDLEDLALAFGIANKYCFSRFSSQARSTVPKKSIWYQYLFAAFEANERAAKAIAKSSLRINIQNFRPSVLLPILDKHHPEYSALLMGIHQSSPFGVTLNPYSSEHYLAANSDFVQKSQAAFVRDQKEELGGSECSCKESASWWAAASRSGGRALRHNLGWEHPEDDDDRIWDAIQEAIEKAVDCDDCRPAVVESFKASWNDLAALWQ